MKEGKTTKKKKARNREYTLVSVFFILLFLSMIGYLVYFNAVKSEDFINSPYNLRQDKFADRVIRGKIQSSDGQVLAQTNVYEGGTEERVYPYSNIFAHVVGYDSHGKSGLESEVNFQLLTSHSLFLNQMKNEFRNQKNTGDTVVTSLNSVLQTTAYYALGDRQGAVVVLEPSTGRILAMVSKPDFDPNYINDNWEWLTSDATNSSLLNRATNGAYPPGSTFKVVTALDYLRKNGSFDKYDYLCEGSITFNEHSIRCYNGTVHGLEDFASAFASSCNCAFADMGVNLGGSSLKKTAQDLLFNETLPLNSYKKSSFSLNSDSPVPLIMQTAIGQGDTLVSPMHMALITSAIANDGVLMEPVLVDEVVSCEGTSIKKVSPKEYKRLMSSSEAAALRELMEGVVSYGTATALNGRGYTAAGKTGSAEFDENGSSHSWFIGYSDIEDPDIVVSIIIENGGTGSEAAVPVAAQIFDAYYFG